MGVLAAPAQAGYVGTTPCGEAVRQFLQIKPFDKCEVVRWTIWHMHGVDGPRRQVDIEAEIGSEGGKFRKIRRKGEWAESRGLPARPNARKVDMRIGKHELGLWLMDEKTAYLLDGNGGLLVGTSGRSYALTLATSSNRHGPPSSGPGVNFPLTPLSSGEDVFGIFEGRTPCAMGQVLGIAVPAGCMRLDWRLTLFQSAPAGTPVSYKLEGGLYPREPRTGNVMLVQSSVWEEESVGFELMPGQGEQPLYLLVGDRNVLFFVDQLGRLGQGTQEYNFVLTRVGP